ncbi:CRISPR-associated endonuclease/helicase Cas3 [Allochromatium warmingii]|uniref:CRISPR-associated endonuclease/helicase Cas3 n=2 Tax=Allochromatium warmingii TaxID=61595 RepID=A0A1H3F0A4_ALLWA|nr:CRISPR-associated endonuclease/helicase Cas3 [Allochromatium warmingii]
MLLEHSRAALHEADSPLRTQLQALDGAGIAAWLTEIAARHPSWQLVTAPVTPTLEHVEARLRAREVGSSKLRHAYQSLDEALATLASFGALLAVDKTDAALQGAQIARQTLPVNAVTHYKAHALAGNDSPVQDGVTLNQRREQIAATLSATWLAHLDQPLLTLTAPTGAGKTLSILHGALQVRAQLTERQGVPPRLIYCLPFTAVIDQNHAVFSAVLRAADPNLADREDLLLKHHHLSSGQFRTEEIEYEADGAGQLLTETWHSEIVVTTFYQLLHTLLSPLNVNLKRAGQLTGALILLDEVQALPLRYWEALRQIFIGLARVSDARIVLLTATRPLIFQPGDAVELLPNHGEHFRALNRTRLHLHHREPLTLAAFAQRLIAELAHTERPTLIIVNRRRAVRELFAALAEALPERPLVALSTHLTPRDRWARIRLIQRLQRQGRPVIVISTQLVEAGVDLSFPVVHRDLAPLDAIIQSAGRCNRHGEQGEGLGAVYLWQLMTTASDARPPQPLWARVYDRPLIEVTLEVLGEAEYWDECAFLDLSERYFLGCRTRQDQQRVDTQLVRGDLAAIEREFQLIEEIPNVSLFICRTERDRRLWDAYRALSADPALSPAEQERRFRAQRHVFMERVIQIPARAGADLERDAVNLLKVSPETYDRAAGLIDLPPAEATCIL